MLGLHKSTVTCLAWSTNGAKLFSGDDKGRVVFTALELDKVQLQHSRTRTGTHTHTHARAWTHTEARTHFTNIARYKASHNNNVIYHNITQHNVTQQKHNTMYHNSTQHDCTTENNANTI